MKAYMVFPSDNPYDYGCVLVFAPNRNKARVLGWKWWPSNVPFDYIEFRAIRRPKFDEFYKRCESPIIETNEELPKGAPDFYSYDYDTTSIRKM